eukprot:8283176-Alexandrium_andersonii.AAC.1
MDAGRLYDSADHFVPQDGVWAGDARLNVAFFKASGRSPVRTTMETPNTLRINIPAFFVHNSFPWA